MKHLILGIDPGRDKIGWAFASCKGELILSGIVPSMAREIFFETLGRSTEEWEKGFAVWTRECRFSFSGVRLKYVALGDGTKSREIAAQLERLQLKIVIVNERGTTLAARKLYWRLHCPVWWQRFLPSSLWIPPRELDDLAAWEIVLRSLAPPL